MVRGFLLNLSEIINRVSYLDIEISTYLVWKALAHEGKNIENIDSFVLVNSVVLKKSINTLKTGLNTPR